MTILVKSSYKIWKRPWDHFISFGAAAMNRSDSATPTEAGKRAAQGSQAIEALSIPWSNPILIFCILVLAALVGAVAGALLRWCQGTAAGPLQLSSVQIDGGRRGTIVARTLIT